MSTLVSRRTAGRIAAVGAFAATSLAFVVSPVDAAPGSTVVTAVCQGADPDSQQILDAISGGLGILPLDISFKYDVPEQLAHGANGPVKISGGVALSQVVIDAASAAGIASVRLSNIDMAGSSDGPGSLAPAFAVTDPGPYVINFVTPVIPDFTYNGTVTAGTTDGTINYTFGTLAVALGLIDGEGTDGPTINLTCSADSVIASTVVGTPVVETTTTTTAKAMAVSTSPKFTG